MQWLVMIESKGVAEMTKLWLVEGYCPKDCYHCLMPVAYEPIEQNGVIQEYQKEKMACRHALKKECDKVEECTFWKKAPETMEKNTNWYEP